MPDLVGEYRHKIDAKGRVSFPSEFRKCLPSDLRVIKAPKEPCLFVFEPESFNQWVASFFEENGGYRSRSTHDRDLRRALNASAKNVEVDSSGRISLAADLRAKACLDKSVVLVGNTDHVEIWDAKRWDEFIGSVDLSELFDD